MAYISVDQEVLFKVLKNVDDKHKAPFCALFLELADFSSYTGAIYQSTAQELYDIFGEELVNEVLDRWFICEDVSTSPEPVFRPIVNLIEYVDD